MSLFASVLLLSSLAQAAQAPKETAVQILTKSENQTRGKSLQAHMKMKIVKEELNHEMEIKVWYSGTDKGMVKILKPEKDRDVGNLRLNLDLWQYLPNLEKIVKIPPSMMLQSWMGSDFTNDDLVKTSSLARDYDSQITKYEVVNGVKTVVIVCHPKPTAPVTWGKVVAWIGLDGYVPIKQEFYLENGKLVKTMTGSKIKIFGKHKIPSIVEMKSLDRNSTTTIEYITARFDDPIDGNIFRQEYLRKPATQ